MTAVSVPWKKVFTRGALGAGGGALIWGVIRGSTPIFEQVHTLRIWIAVGIMLPTYFMTVKAYDAGHFSDGAGALPIPKNLNLCLNALLLASVLLGEITGTALGGKPFVVDKILGTALAVCLLFPWVAPLAYDR